MKFKGNKKLKLASYIAIIGILALVVGTSFALFNTVVESSENQVIKVGAIALEYKETGTSLKNANLTIQTDEAALASSNYYSFSIKNIGSEKAYYKVLLIDEEGKTNTLDYSFVRANVTIDGIQGNVFNLQEVQNVIEDGTIEVGDTKEYILRLWLNFGDLTDDEIEQELNKEAYLKIKVIAEQIPQIILTPDDLEILACDEMIEDVSGANAPELATNMIPVCYNSTKNVWVKADSTNASESNKWYSYSGKTWANAITVTEENRDVYLEAEVGSAIRTEDINTMWVWVPRFSATTNTLDCSTLVEPTAEKYPQCYQNLSDTDKQKAIAALQQFGDTNPEQTLNYLISGGVIVMADMAGDLEAVVQYYNSMAAPDSISIDYSTFFQDRVVLGANGGTQANPGSFTINFVNSETSAHDAFTFGEQNLSGIWVGKFETSHSTLSESTTGDSLACINDACENAKGIEILPNKKTLRYNSLSNFFYAGRSIEQIGNYYGLVSSEIDTHMMKNSEWASVAYLTQSIYGRCTSQLECKDIGINNKSGYVTGYGAPAGSGTSVVSGTYETVLGMDASTTGNIYGVYDMSGGTVEYVMGFYNTDSTENYDFLSDDKYYNQYGSFNEYYTSNQQHAIIDTWYWYGDGISYMNDDNPWMIRGYYNSSGIYAGIFSIVPESINVNTDITFRAVIIK